uniref:Metalloendoproteinase 1 n=1 Tax=Anthurium amnicola TaxID=1678845 RepID=A0A1D1ZDW7_9ARAE
MASCPSMVINLSPLLLGAMSVLLVFPLSTVAWGHPNRNHHHGWASFQNLSGCALGETRPALADLKRYLHHFGYLSDVSAARDKDNFTDYFDAELESALITYQKFFNLNVTGRLDASTLDLITSPRCGVPDVVVHVNSTATDDRRRSLYSYFPGRPVWPYYKRQLSYKFVSPAIAPVRGLFNRAFTRWSRVTPLSFLEIGRGYADITIAFTGMDGPGGTLAYAYAPTNGRMLVDLSENWWVQRGALSQYSDQYDLESVVVHEIGHLLGLDHSRVWEAIMFPQIPPRTRKVDLSNDDLQGIWGLYGRRF